MYRRHLMATTCAAALLLAGCGTLTQQQDTQLHLLIAGAQVLEADLTAAVPELLAGTPAISAKQAAAVRSALAAVTTATAALARQPTLAAGTPYVQAIEGALNTIVGVAAGLPQVPEPAHTDLVLAAKALPALEAIVGLAIKDGSALAAAVKAGQIAATRPTGS